MSSTFETLRSSTIEDLLCVPGVCLGFTPSESCVVLGMSGCYVEFCVRVDLAWLAAGLDALVQQIGHASWGIPEPSFHILGYAAAPLDHVATLRRLSQALGDRVLWVLVASGDRYWHISCEPQTPPEGTVWDPRASNLAASAVYAGLNVASSRDVVVAEVQPPTDADHAAAMIRSARRRLRRLPRRQQAQRLDEYLDRHRLDEGQAAEVALLMQSAPLADGVIARLGLGQAPSIRVHLAAARRVSTREQAPEVLAALALACWCDRQGAQLTECIRQLQELAPGHRLLPLLGGLHQLAVKPPSRWAP